MRVKTGLIVVACLLMSFAAYAQQGECRLTVSGHVYTSDTAQLDAKGASVKFPSLRKGIVTDNKGDFSMTGICPGKTRIVISYQGYKTLDSVFSIRGNTTLNFLLFSNVEELTSITVTGEVVKRDQITTAIKTVLAGAALDATRGLSLGESLKSIAGVNSLQTGPSISKPVIHGVYSNRVLIMNNGVRQEGQNWGNDHAPEIDPFIATRITVVKGAASIRYGSDAIGGVILLDPRDMPSGPGVDGELNLVGLSNSRAGVASGMVEGGAGGKLQGLSWRLQGTVKKAGNTEAADYFLNNTGYNENDYSATLQYNKTHYGGSIYFSQFDTKIGIAQASVADNANDLEEDIARGRPLNDGTFSYPFGRPYQTVNHKLFKMSGYWDLPRNSGKLEAVYAYQHDIRKEYDANPVDNADTSLNTNGIPDLFFQLNTITGDLIWEHPAWHRIVGSIGLNFITHENFQQGTSYQELIPNFEDYGGGLFAIEKYAVRKWVVEAGIRYDYRWLQAYKLNPTDPTIKDQPVYNWKDPTINIGATYKFNDHLSADYNFGTAWRAPQAIELFAFGVHQSAGDWETGDSTLTLERAYNNNLSFTYNSKKLVIEAGGYVNYFHHYIYAKPDLTYKQTLTGYYPSFTYTQVNALFEGADLSITYNFARNLSLISKTSIVRAHNEDIHNWLVFVPADRYDNTLRYEWPSLGEWKNVFVSVNNLVVSRQTRVPPNSDFAAPPPGYMLWGASAGFSVPFDKRQLKVSLAVTNLGNADYRDYMDRFRYFFADPGRDIALRLIVPLDIKKQ
jgi:iron complex outermembrane receptor protein